MFKAITDKHQTVAVKVVDLRAACDDGSLDEAIEQETAEIAVLKSVRHPNIVLFLKSERSADHKLFIFTELIAGHSLFQLMQLQKKLFDEFGVRKFI